MKVVHPQRLILSRIDNIGDVVLTLPMAGLIKQHYPQCEIIFLARNYVKPVVDACPSVDQFLAWDDLDNLPQAQQVAALQVQAADTFIHVFPKKNLAPLVKAAGTPHRIGVLRSYHLWRCNHIVNFSRKRSRLHEGQLNLKLLRPLGIAVQDDRQAFARLLQQSLNTHGLPALPVEIQQQLSADKFNLLVQPCTNGNTCELPIARLAAILQQLPAERFQILINATHAEGERLKNTLFAQCPNLINLSGKLSLAELMQLIYQCDALLSNGTGPLHLASALNKPIIGLYPNSKTNGPQRWGPLSEHSQALVATAPCHGPRTNCDCMQSLSTDTILATLMELQQMGHATCAV
jgi:heptosyltransferase-3